MTVPPHLSKAFPGQQSAGKIVEKVNPRAPQKNINTANPTLGERGGGKG